jgi:hypothetical protein
MTNGFAKVVHYKPTQPTVTAPSPSKGEGVGWGSRSQCGHISSTSPSLYILSKADDKLSNNTYTLEAFFMSSKLSAKVKKNHWMAKV